MVPPVLHLCIWPRISCRWRMIQCHNIIMMVGNGNIIMKKRIAYTIAVLHWLRSFIQCHIIHVFPLISVSLNFSTLSMHLEDSVLFKQSKQTVVILYSYHFTFKVDSITFQCFTRTAPPPPHTHSITSHALNHCQLSYNNMVMKILPHPEDEAKNYHSLLVTLLTFCIEQGSPLAE